MSRVRGEPIEAVADGLGRDGEDCLERRAEPLVYALRSVNRLFSTRQVAKICQVTQPMVSRWSERGLLKPSGRSKTEKARRHTWDDLVAGFVVAGLRAGSNLSNDDIAEIGRLVQRPQDDKLKRSFVLAIAIAPGIDRRIWVSPRDRRGQEFANKMKADNREAERVVSLYDTLHGTREVCGVYASVERLVEQLDNEGIR